MNQATLDYLLTSLAYDAMAYALYCPQLFGVAHPQRAVMAERVRIAMKRGSVRRVNGVWACVEKKGINDGRN